MSEYTLEQLRDLDYGIEANRRALLRAIGEARGFTVVKIETGNMPYVLHLNGTPYEVSARIGVGKSYLEQKAWSWLPDWDCDLTAADALLDDTFGVHWLMAYPIPFDNCYRVKGITYYPRVELDAAHTDKCIVRCLAYLTYAEWKQAQQETTDAH